MKREMFIHLQVHKRESLQSVQNPESTIYNIPFLFELDNSVDVQKLSAAVTAMVNAHSYLLTKVYLNDDGEMVQCPCEKEFVPEIIETTNDKFETVKNELVRPFKLEKGHLFRAEIYLTEDKKYLLRISIISLLTAIPMTSFLQISTEHAWVKNSKKNLIRDLMRHLMKSSR